MALLAFLYGFATRTFSWFPSSFLQRAWVQGRRIVSAPPPDFLTPRVYDRSGAEIVRAGAMQPGLTLITSSWKDPEWKAGLELIDRHGETLHRWRIDPSTVFPESAKRRAIALEEMDIQGSHLFPNGDVLVNVEYAGAVRLDACSRVRWTLAAGNHHSIAEADDGSFWIPGVTQKSAAESGSFPDGFPGLTGPLYQDFIMRVSSDGEVLKTINVLDVLYVNGLHRHIPKQTSQPGTYLTHLNDVEPLSASLADEYPLFEAGDLLVSLKFLDLVFVFDPESGKVKWHTSHPFARQHDPDFLGDGWVGVFDNNADYTPRGTMLGGSRIIALQPHTGSTDILFPTEKSDRFYTVVRGKWQELENGNLLLTESAAGRVVEVTPDGETVWEWIAEPHDGFVPYVSKGQRVSLLRQKVDSWRCSPGNSIDNRSR